MPEHVLITVSGPDHPGIVARLSGLLAEAQVPLLAVAPAVVQRQLTLGLLVEASPAHEVFAKLSSAADELKVKLTFAPVSGAPSRERVPRDVVTVIGQNVGARELNQVSAELARHGANIERIVR